MINKIGSHNQFAGHEGMQVPAGLRTPEREPACFIRLEFYLFDLVPIRLDFVVFIFPFVF